MKKVKKAIIPAAGLGTRFLPATKAMPKEMLPIVDKPTIQYIVEEAIESGIEDIIIVTGKGKRAIEDHFDSNFELEQSLIAKEKYSLLDKVNQSSKVDIHYIRQKEPMGLGHAVWCARKFIGDEPFAVLLGDDIVQADTPGLKQLIDQYEQTISSVIGVQTVPNEETHRYGIIDPSDQSGRRYQVNEIQRVFAYDFEGKRYDVGEKLGFIKTTIEMAMQDQEMKEDLEMFMQSLLQEDLVSH